MSERGKVTEQHRRRRAVVYVRQSTLHQVERNVESSARQYALRERANVRFHRSLRCRPLDRLDEELATMRSLPERMPDVERWFVTRVPPDPYLRVDTNDYSLDPRLVGRRVEVRVSQRDVLAACLDTGELACRHPRSFACYRTITALEHARALRELRGSPPEPEVELRPLARYDALIPA